MGTDLHAVARTPSAAALRGLRVAHLTTVDISLLVLLGTELRHAVEQGCEVYGLSAPGPCSSDLAALGVTHVPLPALTRSWSLRRDLRAACQLAVALRRLRPDVLHVHTPKPGVLGRVIGRLAGVPVVVNTCHGLWLRPEDGWPKRTAVLAVEALAARFSHAELYQNPEDAALLRRYVSGHRQVVGNGIDLDRFRPDPVARAQVRAELGVGPDELLVGGVGRVVREKGVCELATAARGLQGRARVVWIGPDDGEVLEEGALDGLERLPFRRDMERLYPALDVFVLPSHREGFPRSAMEAAACGVASVLSDIRGCREIGQDGREVLLVPSGDPAALQQALGRLLDDALLRTRLGEALQRRARQHFDQRAVAQASLDVYAAVLAGSRPVAR